MSEVRIPDAVLVPEAMRTGARSVDRINSILAIVEPMLGLDRARGQKAWLRRQHGGYLFCTSSPHDTLLFDTDHERSGEERYEWVTEGEMRKGYLRA